MFSVAKRLEIDYAPAMVDFEFKNGQSYPIFDGIVVCAEFKDAILEVNWTATFECIKVFDNFTILFAFYIMFLDEQFELVLVNMFFILASLKMIYSLGILRMFIFLHQFLVFLLQS